MVPMCEVCSLKESSNTPHPGVLGRIFSLQYSRYITYLHILDLTKYNFSIVSAKSTTELGQM